MDIGYSVGN
jgi:alpha-glucosidase (family GH31 glycosyl hydrolase)